ncbi:MAG: succinylglutamate desuccinylase [Chitinivibrionales bacterium]|nr:succinylglutamate desuccinylase [Chitinivibrionales bacterium]
MNRTQRPPVEIGDKRVESGTNDIVNLAVTRLYTHTNIRIPIYVNHSRKEGPVLFVSAAVHGDEINGVETIRRLLKHRSLHRMRGTLIAIPIVNIFGFINHSRYLPDRRDLNRHFPGSDKGSLTSRLANLLMEEVVGKCTHGIDLHTGSNHRYNLPQIRASLNDPETRRLALAFGVPVVLDSDMRDGSMRQAVHEMGIPMLLYEGGEALRFNEAVIRSGLRGILAVMNAIGMIQRKKRSSKIQPGIAKSSVWVRARMSGIFYARVRLGDVVEKGEIIGKISDPLDTTGIDVISPASGVIIGLTNLPLTYSGDALVHIATYDKLEQVEDSIEAFIEESVPLDHDQIDISSARNGIQSS